MSDWGEDNKDGWLEELQVGSRVFISRNRGSVLSRAVVKRITKTQIITASKNGIGVDIEYKFKKTSGSAIGNDKWDSTRLASDNEENNAIYYRYIYHYKVRHLLGKVVIPDDIEELKKMFSILKEWQPKEEDVS